MFIKSKRYSKATLLSFETRSDRLVSRQLSPSNGENYNFIASFAPKCVRRDRLLAEPRVGGGSRCRERVAHEIPASRAEMTMAESQITSACHARNAVTLVGLRRFTRGIGASEETRSVR